MFFFIKFNLKIQNNFNLLILQIYVIKCTKIKAVITKLDDADDKSVYP